jgi:hypothetical protein
MAASAMGERGLEEKLIVEVGRKSFLLDEEFQCGGNGIKSRRRGSEVQDGSVQGTSTKLRGSKSKE